MEIAIDTGNKQVKQIIQSLFQAWCHRTPFLQLHARKIISDTGADITR